MGDLDRDAKLKSDRLRYKSLEKRKNWQKSFF